MTDDPIQKGPLRVGGSPAFVAAHGIAAETHMAFDQAYALSRIVLDEGGGPVPFTGRTVIIRKLAVTALAKLGLLEVVGSSDFDQRAYVQLNVDGRLSELLDAKYAGVRISFGPAQEKLRWVAVATQQAFDLVARNLPK
jgi:hypothetical protein